MLISSPAVEKEWGWGNGLSNPWQMRGFHSKEWPWEFSFGQTRLRSKAGILFSVRSGRRFASSRSQPGLHGLPPMAPAPASPKQDREGEGRAGSPGRVEMPCGRPSAMRDPSRCRTPKLALQIPAGFLSASFWATSSVTTSSAQPSTGFPATAVICDLSELPLWASVFPTVCDLTDGCVLNTGSREAPPSTLNTGSSAP